MCVCWGECSAVAYVAVRGQLVRAGFLLQSLWVLGIELRLPSLGAASAPAF